MFHDLFLYACPRRRAVLHLTCSACRCLESPDRRLTVKLFDSCRCLSSRRFSRSVCVLIYLDPLVPLLSSATGLRREFSFLGSSFYLSAKAHRDALLIEWIVRERRLETLPIGDEFRQGLLAHCP
jgi:hypothetical protein